MTVKELYELLNEDYDYIYNLYMSDERIIKYVNIFYKDNTIELLKKHLNNREYTLAFKTIHAFKGMCDNLCFMNLKIKVSELTEILRNYKGEDYTYVLNELIDSYDDVMNKIKTFLE